MGAFQGTWRLVLLALRRDRIKLTIWILAIAGILFVSIPAVEETYSTEEQRTVYATTISTSIVGRAYGGVPDGTSLGSVAMVEMFTFTAVLVAFMSTLAVIRHTRQNEEMGSAELIGSTAVGRWAQLAAGVMVATGANILLGILGSLIMLQSGAFSAAASWCFGLSLMAVGIAFTAIAAVAAQLTTTSRAANAIAGGSIGVAYLLRAIGDAFGEVHLQSFSVTSAWPSWLSPIGWGQQIHPLTQQNWQVFWVFGGFVIAMIALAFVLLRVRDEGAGLLPARGGPATAPRGLRHPLGLAWRLQRGVLLGWLISFALLGVIFGGMANEFQSLIDSVDLAQQYLITLGGSGDVQDAFFGAMFSVTAIAALGYAVQALTKLRTEETSGRMEAVLATAVHRVQWLFSHAIIVLVGVAMLLFAVGASAGISYVVFADASTSEVVRLAGAAIVQLPAVFVMSAAIVLLFAALPRFMVAFGWALFIAAMLISQLGALLKLPDWVLDISPFTHMPSAPLEEPTLAVIAWPVGIGVALLIIASFMFRYRNMTT